MEMAVDQMTSFLIWFLQFGVMNCSSCICLAGWLLWASFLQPIIIISLSHYTRVYSRVFVQLKQRPGAVPGELPAVALCPPRVLCSDILSHLLLVGRPTRPGEGGRQRRGRRTHVRNISSISPTSPQPSKGDSCISQIALSRHDLPSIPKVNRQSSTYCKRGILGHVSV